jgi:hypothetical protein
MSLFSSQLAKLLPNEIYNNTSHQRKGWIKTLMSWLFGIKKQ